MNPKELTVFSSQMDQVLLDARHPAAVAAGNPETGTRVVAARSPVRMTRYAIRRRSGGAGSRPGGHGLVCRYDITGPAQVSLLTERRSHGPWGLEGGESGKPVRDLCGGAELPGKAHLHLDPGDRLTIETPGGGGWGAS